MIRMRGIFSMALLAYEYRSETDKKFMGDASAVEPRALELQEISDALGMYQATGLRGRQKGLL